MAIPHTGNGRKQILLSSILLSFRSHIIEMRIECEEKKTHGLSSEAALCFHGVCACVYVHVCASLCVCVALVLEIPEYSYIKAWLQDTDCEPASLRLKIAWVAGCKHFP